MLDGNIPSDAPDEVVPILRDRIPNYCHECGEEVVLAGNPLEVSKEGFYDHIDTEAVCMSPDCSVGRWRFGNAIEQARGHEHFEHPSGMITEGDGDEIFGDFVGWCNIHRQRMTVTKTHLVDSDPARQWKCEDCDLVCTVVKDD